MRTWKRSAFIVDFVKKRKKKKKNKKILDQWPEWCRPPKKAVYKWKKISNTPGCSCLRVFVLAVSCTWNAFLPYIGGWVLHSPPSSLYLNTTSVRHTLTIICKTVTPTLARYPRCALFHKHLTPPNILCNVIIYYIDDLLFPLLELNLHQSREFVFNQIFFHSCITSPWHFVHICQKYARKGEMNEKYGKY